MAGVHCYLELAIVELHESGEVSQVSVLTVVELLEKLEKIGHSLWDRQLSGCMYLKLYPELGGVGQGEHLLCCFLPLLGPLAGVGRGRWTLQDTTFV